MCDKTRLERNTGKFFARRLVKHLVEMGAGACSLPVYYKGKKYVVVVSESKCETGARDE